ncbi:histone-lysine N-methyltransferase SETMAR [Trichonephila clavipes]|nr:histone-lysine N-methyltransferase SETMAR [Trichonephila clavipes]
MPAVETKNREKRIFTIITLSLELSDVPRSVVYKIVTEDLNFRKLCSRWVPRLLTAGHIEKRKRINSDAYCATLRKLRRALQNKRRGMLSKGVLPLLDSARLHTSQTPRELIEFLGWEVLDHAPYSSALARSYFHLFQYLKHSLGRKRFSDNKVKMAVNTCLSDQTADFFEDSFQNLVLS